MSLHDEPLAAPETAALPLVAVFVGTDHHRFDRLATWVSTLASEGWARWFIQHGATPWTPTAHVPVRGAAYVDQTTLDDVLREAGAVVTHGGPGMIMDAHLAGHTPVVVARDPKRHEHVDDHQMRFVARLADRGQIHVGKELFDFRQRVLAELATGPAQRPSVDPVTSVCDRFAHLVATTRDHRRPRGN